MPENLWTTIKGHLGGIIPAHALNTWFEPIKPVTISNNELVLEVPNQFFYEWIESHYKQSIRRAIKNSSNNGLTVRLVVSKNSHDIKNQEQKKESVLKEKPVIPHLNRNYTFEAFIEGANNQFAKTATQTVAEAPGKQAFNPLIIYGGVGLGKTHLLHAIGNRIMETDNGVRVVMATSEKFTLDFVNGLRRNQTVEFARHYRRADVLLIDDIQFFRGKEQTQEQFFHTFNELYQAGKQIVLTTDRFPGEMRGLQDRLLSRFQSGLSVDVQPPDFEVRVAILMDKAERNGVDLPYDIIEFIATHMKSNIRDLEGTIIRLLARSSLMNQDIDYDLVHDVVKERLGKKPLEDLSIEDIVRKVSQISRVAEKDIVGKSRKKDLVQARQAAMFLCRNLLDVSLNNIGVYFGGRDHTTVIHAIRRVEEKEKKDRRLRKMIERLSQELKFPYS
ncbi:uncharacterized protein METZ01_LOCUS172450 [marine metagenome]|jgi:chromosomal replication initiator protein|uniref:Chromosomal replication initiator protein DnaA n=1 Tax=marine metagenome TaxID=408172 RepID=A0A382C0J6_9ZZZZ|tara:strand:- start:1887 stop:3224 length:1338 start_codon:yes stop_codon:yes gene_type:complete